jgi:hypothetical protein
MLLIDFDDYDTGAAVAAIACHITRAGGTNTTTATTPSSVYSTITTNNTRTC